MKTKKQSEYVIYTTKNYDIFKKVAGNRLVNKAHVAKLVKSIESSGYVGVPILVNETRNGNLEMIDGQHRLEALRQLKLPVEYIVKHGLTLKDMQKLNSNSKNWSQDDFMNSYCRLGVDVYVRYKTFKDKWKFGHDECWALLNNVCSESNGVKQKFKDGDLTIRDYGKAVYQASLVTDIGKYYKDFKRRKFVFAMLRMFNNKKYSHKRLVSKLEYQSSKLVLCDRVDDYLKILQKIYNFKATKQNRVRFFDDL
tara:strand:- start:2133 stop:2891 length:759 start_codon:yes stop_codon:yes gene_type:complete